jgi:DNA polymerase III delta' subunit
VEREEPPHALLLVGPAQVGKRTLAFDLAAGLLCTADDARSRPCRACGACRKVAHGNHADLHLLAPDGAGEQIRLPQVQRLVADLALLPMEGHYRVAIVDAAHRLNPDAQNALLKTLEEPPARATIVLCVDDLAAILPTVVSRSARLRLGAVAASEVVALLAERGLDDPARATAVARLAGGRPGLALALAASPEAVLAHGRLSRVLLDLVRADRRTRLGAAAGLIAEGAALDAALSRSVTAEAPAAEMSETADGADGSLPSTAGRRRVRRVAGSGAGADAGSEGGEARGRRASPAERRRAVARVLEVWRDVARDLAVASRGGRPEIRQIDLLEEYVAAGTVVERGAVTAFVGRLDALGTAIEAYANPELALDALLLRWPAADAGSPA